MPITFWTVLPDTVRVEQHPDTGAHHLFANDRDGREYIHLHPFPSYHKAEDLAYRVRANLGVIMAHCWSCRAVYGTASWHLDGMEERQIEDERDAP